MRIHKLGEDSKRTKLRKAYEARIKDELEWGSNITSYDEDNDYAIRHGSRLDRSRVLETDEDNLFY